MKLILLLLIWEISIAQDTSYLFEIKDKTSSKKVVRRLSLYRSGNFQLLYLGMSRMWGRKKESLKIYGYKGKWAIENDTLKLYFENDKKIMKFPINPKNMKYLIIPDWNNWVFLKRVNKFRLKNRFFNRLPVQNGK